MFFHDSENVMPLMQENYVSAFIVVKNKMYWYGSDYFPALCTKLVKVKLSLCLVSHQKFMKELDMAVINQSKQIYW